MLIVLSALLISADALTVAVTGRTGLSLIGQLREQQVAPSQQLQLRAVARDEDASRLHLDLLDLRGAFLRNGTSRQALVPAAARASVSMSAARA